MALLSAASLGLSLSAGAQTLARDLGFRLPSQFGSPEAPLADTLGQPPRDAWFGRDKAYHVGASFGIALGAHVVLTEGLGVERDAALPVAAGVALLVGVAKETADERRQRHPLFSWKDLTADAAGVALALAVARL